MRILITSLIGVVLISYATAFSQNATTTYFKSDLNKADIKTVLKAVADWQIKTPLTHDPADWTNGALYAGMNEWASIAGNNSYFEWLKDMCSKNQWLPAKREDPLGKYYADDYCVAQTYIELYRKYKDKNMINPMMDYLDLILKYPATGDLKFENT